MCASGIINTIVSVLGMWHLYQWDSAWMKCTKREGKKNRAMLKGILRTPLNALIQSCTILEGEKCQRTERRDGGRDLTVLWRGAPFEHHLPWSTRCKVGVIIWCFPPLYYKGMVIKKFRALLNMDKRHGRILLLQWLLGDPVLCRALVQNEEELAFSPSTKIRKLES